MASDGNNRRIPPPPPRPPGGLPPPRLPPPLPSGRMASPSSRRMPVAAPTPSVDGFMSTSEKMSLAEIALALRDEQLEAKVVHYKAELPTSPELDAVTQQVITELQNLQAAARAKGPITRPPPRL